MLTLILAAAGLFLLTSQKRPAAKPAAPSAPPAPSNPARPTGISPGNAIAPPPPNESGQLQAVKVDSATPVEAVIVTPDRPRGVGLASQSAAPVAFVPSPSLVPFIADEPPAPTRNQKSESLTGNLAHPEVYQDLLTNRLGGSSAEFLKAWYSSALADLQAGLMVESPPEFIVAKRLGTIEGQRWLLSVKSGDTSVSAADFLSGKTVASPDPVASNKLYYAAQRGVSDLA